MSTLSNFATLLIAAGKIEPINSEGRNFHVVFAPVDLEIKWAGGEFGIYTQGTGIEDMPDGVTFKRLEVKNPTTSDILVTIYIGGPRYKDSRAAIIEPKTEAKGWNGASINAAAGVTFTGVASGRQIRRKAIQISNLDATLSLQLRDPNGFVLLTVFPQTNITQPISEFVQVWNPNGAAVACNISEIWWGV